MDLKPLGDTAILAYLPDEPAAVRLAAAVRAAGPDWLVDVVPAYASVGVFFDPERTTVAEVAGWLRTAGLNPAARPEVVPATHIIPVCYERGPDLGTVAAAAALSVDDVVRLHAGTEYTVHAVGFVPGFAYLGYLPAAFGEVARLPTPRTRVAPGSVGVAGRQTGVYPLARPGGWPLIGRTPLVLVDVAGGYFPLRVGDRVRFAPISKDEYHDREGERLTPRSRTCP